jgi:hypothetical protein
VSHHDTAATEAEDDVTIMTMPGDRRSEEEQQEQLRDLARTQQRKRGVFSTAHARLLRCDGATGNRYRSWSASVMEEIEDFTRRVSEWQDQNTALRAMLPANEQCKRGREIWSDDDDDDAYSDVSYNSDDDSYEYDNMHHGMNHGIGRVLPQMMHRAEADWRRDHPGETVTEGVRQELGAIVRSAMMEWLEQEQEDDGSGGDEDDEDDEENRSYRFGVDTRVECKCDGMWATGVVVALNYREQSWQPTRGTAPYQVRLDDGRLIFAPRDSNDVIRLERSGV